MQKILPFLLILLSLESFSQRLISVYPNKARNGESLTVTISGENMNFSQSSPAIYLSIKKGTITKFIFPDFRSAGSPTEISADFQISGDTLVAPLGLYDLTVTGQGTLPKSFEVYQPQINKVTPSRAVPNQTLDVNISGLNTRFTQGSNTVYFSQSSPTLIISANGLPTVNNNQELISNFTIPASAPYGIYDVNIVNSADGTVQRIEGFEVYNPNYICLLSANYAAANRGESFKITIKGKNTHFSLPDLFKSVKLYNPYVTNPIVATYVIPVSDTEVDAYFDIPFEATLCFYDLIVYNTTDGPLALRSYFEINTKTDNPLPVGIQKNLINALTVFPNPFKDKLELHYDIAFSEKVTIEIYNLLGEKVMLLANNELQDAGSHKYSVSKKDLNNLSGLYFLKATIGKQILTKKLILAD